MITRLTKWNSKIFLTAKNKLKKSNWIFKQTLLLKKFWLAFFPKKNKIIEQENCTTNEKRFQIKKKDTTLLN